MIKQGACLVQSSEDIFNELNIALNWALNSQKKAIFEKAQNEQLPFPELLANVGVEATSVDILAQRTNIKVSELMVQLLELELHGHIAAVEGGYIRTGRGEL